MGLFVLLGALAPQPSMAGLTEDIELNIRRTAQEATFTQEKEIEVDSDFLVTRVGNMVAVVLSFISVIFFLFVFYGGLLWMMARGNEDKVEKARKLIRESAIALLIVASAYLLTLVATRLAIGAAGGETAYTESTE